MSKDEFVFVNEERTAYMELIMDKYPGSGENRLKRQRFYDKLSAWRNTAEITYKTQKPRDFPHGPDYNPAPIKSEQSWELIRL